MIKNKILIILSLLFVVSQYLVKNIVFDFNLDLIDTIYYLIISFIFIFLIFKGVYLILDTIKIKDDNNSFLNKFFKHPLLNSFIVITICWLPILIIMYPGSLGLDASSQINQFINHEIVNHHPAIHTFLLGFIVSLGKLIKDYNLGLFLFTLFQSFILAVSLAYSIKYLKGINVNNKILLGILFSYTLVVFPFICLTDSKDVIYTAFAILYTIIFHKLIYKENNKINNKDIIFYIFIIVLFSLFRKEGIIIFILSFPLLFLINKKIKKMLRIVFFVSLFICGLYSLLLLLLNIPTTSKDILSVPFQQTARYVKYHSSDISEYEKQVIDKILNYDTLAERYNPRIADPVKKKFNSKISKNDYINYLNIYIKQFFKDPYIYISAFINNNYSFYYVDSSLRFVDEKIPKNNLDIKYLDKTVKVRDKLSEFQTAIKELLIFTPAFSTWLIFLLIGYSFSKKNYKNTFVYLPVILNILVCLVSPVCSYRYAIHYIFQVPFLIGILLNNNKSLAKNK